MSGFQTKTTVQPAIGVEGDFSSANPRCSVISGAGAFVAGSLGVYVGRFAWAAETRVDDVGGPAVVNSFGGGPVTGCAVPPVFCPSRMPEPTQVWLDRPGEPN